MVAQLGTETTDECGELTRYGIYRADWDQKSYQDCNKNETKIVNGMRTHDLNLKQTEIGLSLRWY